MKRVSSNTSTVLSNSIQGARRSLAITLKYVTATALASDLHQLAHDLQAKLRRLETLPPLKSAATA